MAQQSEPTGRFVTLRPRRKRWFQRLWERLKGVAVVVSAVSAAFAAIYSRDLACTIADTERNRLAQERMKFSYGTYLEYIKSRTADQVAKRPRLRCLSFLLSSSNITDDELRALFGFYPNFTYDPARHAQLKDLCLDDSEPVAAWGEAQTQQLNFRLGSFIFALDQAFIGYRYPIGDSMVICENFSGFFTAGVAQKEFGYGIMGRLLERAIAIGSIRDDNFPNLKYFTERVSLHTQSFTKIVNCATLVAPVADPCEWLIITWFNNLKGWVWSMIRSLSG